jgi:hypothetical protein
MKYIKQERPGENTWIIWRKFLGTICRNENEHTIYNTKETKEERTKHSIGTKITKYWSGVPYIGQMISSISKYYKVQYEDGDEEELNHGEVDKYMKKNCGEGRMTGDIGKRMRLRIKLGDWNIQANESERLWPFYFSCAEQTLYRSYIERNGIDKEASTMTATVEKKRIHMIMHRQKPSIICLLMQYRQM